MATTPEAITASTAQALARWSHDGSVAGGARTWAGAGTDTVVGSATGVSVGSVGANTTVAAATGVSVGNGAGVASIRATGSGGRASATCA
jgi:hypothetical protein